MNLRDVQKKYFPKERFGTISYDHRDYHPDSVIPQLSHRITRDGEVLARPSGVSRVCLKCNEDKLIVPKRLSGFTLYECLNCGHMWRDSYNKPGQVLRPREWRDIRKKGLGRLQGRILI